MRVEGASPDALRRFEREARAALALEHPNIVTAYRFDQSDEGELYLAMELLEGETLARRLQREGRLGADAVIDVGRQACSGLEAAHVAGIVHRDVKPGNLFLVEGGVVKLLDFGLALVARGDETRLTQPGLLMGTPSYMAPEQARGQRSEDPRTDLWSLGAVLYHALVGRPPFAAPTALGELVRIVHEEPDVIPEEIAAEAPSGLVAAIRQSLRKPREERFARAAVFAEALRMQEPQSSDETVHARGPRIASRPTPVTPAFGGLSAEVRLVSVVVAEGVTDPDLFLPAVRAQGGEAAVLVGGRAFGTFGGAEWDGDEAERAVRAALEARRGVLRIGVGTGRAVAEGGRHGAVTGAAVAAAEAVLSARGVGVDEPTWRQVHRLFRVEEGPERPDGTLRAAGGAEARAWRVTGALGPSSAGAQRRTRAVRAVPVVGRDAELAQLRALYERAADERRPAAALLVGAPGMGKSRLCLEVRRWLATLDEPHVVLEGRGDGARRFRAFSVLADALRARAGLDEMDMDNEEARRRIVRLVEEAAVPADLAADAAAFLGELVGARFPETAALRTARRSPDVFRDQVRLALGALFDALGNRATVVLIVEDLHAADGASLDTLDFLLIGQRPLFLLATARPHLLSERPEALLDATRVELGSLSRRALRQIVRGHLGRDDEAIVERAAGNPFFAEELALGAREAEERGGAAGATATAELPLTVQGAIQSRLDHLPADEKDLLKRAAIFRDRFWSEALVALGVPDPAPLLARLRRRDLVSPRPSSGLAGCNEWACRQALVRDVAYAMLTEDQRRALHLAAGTWLETRPDAAPEEVAEQHESAGDPDRALDWWARAVESADARGDSEAVLAHSDHVVGRLSDPARAFNMHDQRYLAAYYLGRTEVATREMVALDGLTGKVDRKMDIRQFRRRGHYLRRRGRLPEVLQFYEKDLEQARAAGDPVWEVLALAGLGGTLADVGRPLEGQALAEHGLVVARKVGDPFYIASAAEGAAYTAGVLGTDIARTFELYREAARLYDACGDVRRAATARSNAGVSLCVFCAWEEASRELEATLAACMRLGLERTRGYAHANLSQARAQMGDFDGARRHAGEAIALGDRTEDARLRVASRYHRALVHLLARDNAAARADVDAALADPNAGPMEADVRTILALVQLADGDARAALAEARRAIDLREQTGAMEFLAVDMFLCAYDALVAQGQASEGRVYATRAAELVRGRAATMEDPALRNRYLTHKPNARALALDAGEAS
jgi:tetratricopeptide (TPR) repeat protein